MQGTTSRTEALEAICRCIAGLQVLCDLIADGEESLTPEDKRDIAKAERTIRLTLRPLCRGTRKGQGVKVYRI